MNRTALLLVSGLLGLASLLASADDRGPEQAVPNGFYATGDVPVKLNVARASLVSQDNFNSSFHLWVETAFDEREAPELWLKVGKARLRCNSRGSEEGKSRSYGFSVDAALAGPVAAFFGIEPQLREHPGYRLAVRFVPARLKAAGGGQAADPVFQAGDEIAAVLEIKNVGKTPFSFMDGGRNRGARNNQFSFNCRHDGKAVIDSGDARHFGGMAGAKTIQPGEVFTKQVELGKWFRLDQPGYYELTGSYYFDVVSGDGSMRTIWTDHTTAEFQFQLK